MVILGASENFRVGPKIEVRRGLHWKQNLVQSPIEWYLLGGRQPYQALKNSTVYEFIRIKGYSTYKDCKIPEHEPDTCEITWFD